MDFSEAKATIRQHAGTEDGPAMATGFLGCLRPYRGLATENFEAVVAATAAVADHLQAGTSADRELVYALWKMCQTSRDWGVRDGGMLSRNQLVTPADRQLLEVWVDIIEHMALHLLRGNGISLAVCAYAEAIAFGRLPAPASGFVSLFAGSLAYDDVDVKIYAAGALGQMGAAAQDAIPALKRCAQDANAEVSRAAGLAIENIMRSC